jgi:predicted metal-dependent phosphoesterase TrpH
MTPEELVHHAIDCGLQGLSITDHDTLDAQAIAYKKATALGLQLLPGVEFSSHYKKTSIHVLAYAFPWNSPLIEEHCQKHTLRRQERNQEMLERLAKHGMPITERNLAAGGLSSALLKKGSYGRPHIAQAMVFKGYVTTLQEAFKKYLCEGCTCYVPGKQFPLEEALEVIHAAKGLAVLAHPHLIARNSIIENLLLLPFDGIEAYYAKFPLNLEKKWIAIAEEKKWIVTGGSDFHGLMKPHIPLGCSWVGEATFEKLHAHLDAVSV